MGMSQLLQVRRVLQDFGGNCVCFGLLDFLGFVRCICILYAIRKINFSSQITKYLQKILDILFLTYTLGDFFKLLPPFGWFLPLAWPLVLVLSDYLVIESKIPLLKS